METVEVVIRIPKQVYEHVNVWKDLVYDDYIAMVGNAILNCTVLPKGHGWIPVSERLPEETGCYLVTTRGTHNDIIDIAYYTKGIWHKANKIIAWMPLPERYKDGE